MTKGKRLCCRYLLSFLVLSLLLSGLIAAAESPAEKQGDYLLSVKVEKDLFTIEADNVPLEAVLDELSRKGAVRVKTFAAEPSSDHITVSFADLNLSDALSRLLRNYSYILDYEKNEPTVIILAFKGSPGSLPKQTQSCAAAKKPMQKIENAPSPQASGQTAFPKGCEKPVSKDKPNYASDENRTSFDEVEFAWAQNVLAMKECSYLWEQAIDELIFMQDGRVTSLLANLADMGETASLREKAVDVLWRNAAKSEFKNTAAVDALKNLSGSTDVAVGTKAQQAVLDYENYMNRGNVNIQEAPDVKDPTKG